MPPALAVELSPHDPAWAAQARERAVQLERVLGPLLVAVHHIGSTSIPAIRAKPILDLIPQVASLDELDGARGAIESLGYQWWGEYGLPGRRYCSLTDAVTGKRLVQLHCYASGSPEITRHLAFRDYLMRRPDLAGAYEAVKLRCRDEHPSNSHDYSDCKNAWIRRVEKDALAALRAD
jgi:GrpB-like predicted nucleotidyltransferase (UPF0157 family)